MASRLDGHRALRSLVLVGLLVPGVLSLGLTPSSAAYLRPGSTERISIASNGTESTYLTPPLMSLGTSTMEVTFNESGRFVAFSSTAANLSGADKNGVSDVFVHDRLKHKTTMVSVPNGGGVAQLAVGACAELTTEIGSFSPSLSGDGRFVVFDSCASNLVPGDTNMASDIFVHNRVSGTTERVSVNSRGEQATLEGRTSLPHSFDGDISTNGLHVGFRSGASNLVDNDSNDNEDVFVRDLHLDKTELVSVSSEEVQGNSGSSCASLSASGRHVLFVSRADNLVPGDRPSVGSSNQTLNGFVRDRETGKTERVTFSNEVNQGGAPVCGTSGGGQHISGDGRYAIFHSQDAMVPYDSNRTNDVMVFDRHTKRTDRISVESDGGESSRQSYPGALSLDGRFVTFHSEHAFFPGDLGDAPNNNVPEPIRGFFNLGDWDVFVYDLKLKSIDWVSLTSGNVESQSGCGFSGLAEDGYGQSMHPGISADGRYVGFESCADDLTPGDTNRNMDAFVRDRGLPLMVGMLGDGQAGTSGGNTPGFSLPSAATADAGIAAMSDADNDSVAGSLSTASEIVQARFIYRPHIQDALVWIDVADLPEIPEPTSLTSSLVYGVSLEIDGIRYEMRAARIDPTSGSSEPSFALFSCASALLCEREATLHGGWGTTGDSIVMQAPLRLLGLLDGGTVTELRSFSGLGSLHTGAAKVLDVAR